MAKVINICAFIAILVVFRNLLLQPFALGGDWPYFYSETIRQFSIFVPSWISYLGNGFGGGTLTYALDSYLYFVSNISVNLFNAGWELIGKAFYFLTFLILLIVSTIYFLRVVFESYQSKYLLMGIGLLLITANTYILILVNGGQMGVALAYAISPLVLGVFFRLFKVIHTLHFNRPLALKYAILAGLSLAACAIFDSRIAYVLVIVVGLFYVYRQIYSGFRRFSVVSFGYFIASGITFFFLSSFWVIPMLIYKINPAAEVVWDYGSTDLFNFLSFANLSNSLALLHPNWPENIFGKVYFLQPEFIVFPILAYSSLLFVNRFKNNDIQMYIIVFSLLGLTGAFLSKGANPPFETVNTLLFSMVPGFGLFRDPTKFYMLTVLSYGVMIPFFLSQATEIVQKNIVKQKQLTYLIPVLFLIFFLFTIRHALLNELSGVFTSRQIPMEYRKLKEFISSQDDFFRVLWLPNQQRFNYYSNTHPAVGATHYFNTSSAPALLVGLAEGMKTGKLQNASIKYIVIPYDSEGEIFVKDRKYDEQQYNYFIKETREITELREVEGFEKVKVFEIPFPKPHLYLEHGDIQNLTVHGPTLYSFTARIQDGTTLHFVENYSPYWNLQYNNTTASSIRSEEGFNIFAIPDGSDGMDATLYFAQEGGYFNARIISAATLFLSMVLLYLLRKERYTITNE